MSDDVRTAMEEWVELKKQLAGARNDIKILNKREKELSAFIKKFMKEKEIDVVKIEDSKVSYKTVKAKGSLTRDIIKKGLVLFFGGDEVRADGALQAILDSVPEKTRESITLTGKK
jgi:coproporphyrinogen III oxidase-like Fe-S oxidoreductase